jgi:hypothetical protein
MLHSKAYFVQRAALGTQLVSCIIIFSSTQCQTPGDSRAITVLAAVQP